MSSAKNTSGSSSQPIPVGKFVSAGPSKVKTTSSPATPRRPVTGLSRWRVACAVLGVALLVGLAGLGVAFALKQRPGQSNEPPVVVPGAQIANVNPLPTPSPQPPRVIAATPEQLLMPREMVRESKPVVHGPETLAALPREIKDEPALTVIEPQPVVRDERPRPAATLEPVGPEPKVVDAPVGERPKADVAAKLPATEKCERFGTKIDFLAMPTLAYEKARKEKERLVMLLHIAGNFEDTGFT